MNGSLSKWDGRVGIGLLLVLSTAVISGVSTFLNTYAVGGTSTDAFVTVRNSLVALAMVPMALLATSGTRKGLEKRDWARLAVIGLIGGSIPFLLFFHGLQMATQAGGGVTASFFYRTLFLMAIVMGIVTLGERLRPAALLGAVLLLGGNALLLSLTSAIWVDGTGYVVLATLLWACEYTLSKWTMRDLPSGTVALGRMGFGAVFLLAYLAFTDQVAAVGAFSAAQWIWVGISAALLVAFVATWYEGLRRVDLGVATSMLVLGFPVTFLLAVALRGSPMSLGQSLGVFAIFAGAALTVGWVLARETGTVLRRAVQWGTQVPP